MGAGAAPAEAFGTSVIDAYAQQGLFDVPAGRRTSSPTRRRNFPIETRSVHVNRNIFM